MAGYPLPAVDPLHRPRILVTLSWGEDNIPNGFIAPGLEAAIRRTAGRYQWLIRLHPNQLRGFATDEGPKFIEYFKQNLAGSAEWERPTHAPLPIVLSEIDLHVSWQSSVAIEAAQMGIKTALLNPRLRSQGANEDYYGFYPGAGLVDLAEETEEAITGWVERNVGSKQTGEAFERYDAEYRRVLDFLCHDSRPSVDAGTGRLAPRAGSDGVPAPSRVCVRHERLRAASRLHDGGGSPWRASGFSAPKGPRGAGK